MKREKTLLIVGGIAVAGIIAYFVLTKPPEPPCKEGETKCVNNQLWACQNGQWVNTGEPCIPVEARAEITEIHVY